MKKVRRSSFKLNPIALSIVLAMASQFSANVAYANGGYGTNTDRSGAIFNVPTYYANSPQGIQPAFNMATHAYDVLATVNTGTALRKFVDPLTGVDGAGIPLAITEKWFNPLTNKQTTDDYYEIAIVAYTQQMHSDLPKATSLRGYVQIETPAIAAGLADAAGVKSEHIALKYPNGTPILDAAGKQVYAVHQPHYLGPIIVATRGTAVRMKYTNYLPYTDATGKAVGAPNGGELPIPVDEHIAGGGPVVDATGKPVLDQNGKPIKFPQNRISMHWHGGDSPWISDGTPHQWIAPAGDASYSIKDATHPNGMGRGDAAQNVPDMPDPGPGSGTLYWPNNISARLMFYHDHASGTTRLNVYLGEAAGYVVTDPVEQGLVSSGTIPNTLLGVGIPLVIQDRTFVPNNIGPVGGTVTVKGVATKVTQSQDAKWDLTHWGQPGDLWFPHVYETNQDPNSIDGTNPVGRWDWGPWFWPVFPAQYSLPTGAYGDVTTTPEAFMDTPIVNGQAYPTLTVDPQAYRFRILSVANDRTFNLGLYQAVDANGIVCDAKNTNPAVAPLAAGQTGALAACTEVRMVPAVLTPGYPANWPTDGRAGGVPDPATAGPDIIQIGNEAGLLPAPAIWPSQPVTYDQNVRSITIFNVLHHDLLLAGAERADVIIDFSKYAGQTLIVYNDAPAPMPGFDPRIDYFTGAGDQTGGGGAYNTPPGYGPNTRTIMQIKVNPVVAGTTAPAAPFNTAALAAELPIAYAASQPAPNIPEKAYDPAFGTSSADNYAHIFTGSLTTNGLFSYTDSTGKTQSLPVINKAIQELFDPVYGRMNATLAVELPFSSATVATTIPLAYIDAPIDNMDAIKDGETQIWKITHNGVDSHPVHFHLVNVQVINRVGWDGVVKPPEANELGWKETLRMNPLEDVYVAVKAVHPVTPFGLPKSQRVLDPSQSIGSQVGFTQIDQLTGNAPTFQTQLVNGVTTNVPTTTYSNQLTDFDNEYVWHCHILGHEENDFMRPFIFHPNVAVPDAPGNVAVSGSTISWADPTPLGGQDAQGIPTAGTNAAYLTPTSSPKNEIGFKLQQKVTTVVTTANPQTQTITGYGISSWTVTNGGSGYTTVPTVTINGTLLNGTAPTATATLRGGSIRRITIANSRAALYSAPPTISISSPGAGGTPATATITSATTTGTGFVTNQNGQIQYNPGTSVTTVATNALAAVPANVTSWTDTTGKLAASGTATTSTTDPVTQSMITKSVTSEPPEVIAFNAAGDSVAGTSTTATSGGAITTAATTSTVPTFTAPGAAVTPPPGPLTGLTQTLNANGSVTLNWNAVAGATSYLVTYGSPAKTVRTASSLTPPTTFTVPAGSNSNITIAAVGAGGVSTASSTMYIGAAYAPVAFTATPGASAGTVTLTWANNPLNVNNVSGLALSWTGASHTFAATSTGATITGLTTGNPYNFTLQAISSIGNSVALTSPALIAP